jgi:probable addiction module antidote protein
MKKYAASVSHEEQEIREFRENPRLAIEYLNYCVEMAFKENQPVYILMGLSTVAKAIGVQKIAKEANLHRVTLHRMLNKRGNPEWRNVFQVFKALGIQPRFEIPKRAQTSPRQRASAGGLPRSHATRRNRGLRSR